MAEPAVRPSTGPLYVDPDAVLLGALKLENELARGGLLPRPTTAVQEILRAVQSANAAMREPSEGDDYAHACGVLASLLDSYRRALAELCR